MPLSIKNQETEATARRLAELTGESLTDAVRIALEERYERVRNKRRRHSLAQELIAIGDECAKLPVISNLTDDELLGYDEFGAPTR
jgi:antitoxin VapB